jgi:predicted amidohydrolase
MLHDMFKVALCSFLFHSDRAKDLRSLSNAVKKAARQQCNLVCFPECALSGLPTEHNKKDIRLAVKIPGKITQKIGLIARKHQIHIAIGLLEKTDKSIFDSVVLFDDQGKMIMKYRRINPQWHTKKAPKSIYREGKITKATKTPFGKIASALCGDIFDSKVVSLIRKANPDYLIVPMSRSFDDDKYDQEQWDKKESRAYAAQIRRMGTTSFLVNALEPRDQGAAFGGCFVISPEGQVLARTKIGKPSFLVWQR